MNQAETPKGQQVHRGQVEAVQLALFVCSLVSVQLPATRISLPLQCAGAGLCEIQHKIPCQSRRALPPLFATDYQAVRDRLLNIETELLHRYSNRSIKFLRVTAIQSIVHLYSGTLTIKYQSATSTKGSPVSVLPFQTHTSEKDGSHLFLLK